MSQEAWSPHRQTKEKVCQDPAGDDYGNSMCLGKCVLLHGPACLSLGHLFPRERFVLLRARALCSLHFQGRKKTGSLQPAPHSLLGWDPGCLLLPRAGPAGAHDLCAVTLSLELDQALCLKTLHPLRAAFWGQTLVN